MPSIVLSPKTIQVIWGWAWAIHLPTHPTDDMQNYMEVPYSPIAIHNLYMDLASFSGPTATIWGLCVWGAWNEANKLIVILCRVYALQVYKLWRGGGGGKGKLM